jgi:two-component system response regulator NreC
MPATKVMIIEDHPIFSKGLAQLINVQKIYTVVGEAQNHAQAMEILKREQPELAIVDLNLGDEDGLDVIKDMHTEVPSLIILVLSMHDERYYAERVLKAGARGYIMKEEAGSQVIDAIKTVLTGKIWLSDAERQREEDNNISFDGKKETSAEDNISSLSDRQLQIFTLIGKGLGTVEIAAKLNLSTKTIDTHKEHIKIKLHCNTSQELRQLAIEWTSHK